MVLSAHDEQLEDNERTVKALCDEIAVLSEHAAEAVQDLKNMSVVDLEECGNEEEEEEEEVEFRSPLRVPEERECSNVGLGSPANSKAKDLLTKVHFFSRGVAAKLKRAKEQELKYALRELAIRRKQVLQNPHSCEHQFAADLLEAAKEREEAAARSKAFELELLLGATDLLKEMAPPAKRSKKVTDLDPDELRSAGPFDGKSQRVFLKEKLERVVKRLEDAIEENTKERSKRMI